MMRGATIEGPACRPERWRAPKFGLAVLDADTSTLQHFICIAVREQQGAGANKHLSNIRSTLLERHAQGLKGHLLGQVGDWLDSSAIPRPSIRRCF